MFKALVRIENNFSQPYQTGTKLMFTKLKTKKCKVHPKFQLTQKEKSKKK